MSDTITQTVLNNLFSDVGVVPPVQRDNHGNIRYGGKIVCAGGKTIDYSKALSAIDDGAIKAARLDSGDLFILGMFNAEHPLGQLESPLKQRCREADEKQQQGK
jgi:hypothetical protein